MLFSVCGYKIIKKIGGISKYGIIQIRERVSFHHAADAAQQILTIDRDAGCWRGSIFFCRPFRTARPLK